MCTYLFLASIQVRHVIIPQITIDAMCGLYFASFISADHHDDLSIALTIRLENKMNYFHFFILFSQELRHLNWRPIHLVCLIFTSLFMADCRM